MTPPKPPTDWMAIPAFATESIFSISTFTYTSVEPSYTITFMNKDKTVGRLSWKTGVFTFEGKWDESAQKFFDYLKPMIDEYIQRNCDPRETPSD